MNHLGHLFLGLLLLAGPATSSPAATSDRPNIVFILADDLGYGDLGAYGQQRIRTPHLDRLAAEGMRFTQHYSGSAVCAPSRCVLMTGKHPGHAFVRDNRELRPEGQEPLPADTSTLPRLLQPLGYVTGAFGKWGLGPPGSTGDPLRQGFDRFFGYNCQRVAHNHYPEYLWSDTERVPLNNPEFAAHQKLPAGADRSNPETYARYAGQDYAPDRITEEALAFIRRHQGTPFFLYYPTTVPHLALQVPPDSLQDYAGKWEEEPYGGERAYLPHPAPRAAYAAMITRLDREVGRMMSLVRELGLEDRTLFIFTSDNGPLYDRLGGTDSDFFRSAAGFRGRKGSLYEGGVRVPLIVRWKGRVPAGATSDRVTGFEDWLPTLLEIAGGKSLVPRRTDGISFAPTLMGKRQKPRPFLYREFPGYGGQQSVRVGDWKAIRVNLSRASTNNPAPTELFNLESDPGETADVAARNPAVVQRLEQRMQQQRAASAEFPFPALDQTASTDRRR